MMNKISLAEVRKLIQNANQKIDLVVNPEVVHCFGAVLQDSKLDSAFKALMLSLPSDAILAMEETVLDAQVFEQARKYG